LWGIYQARLDVEMHVVKRIKNKIYRSEVTMVFKIKWGEQVEHYVSAYVLAYVPPNPQFKTCIQFPKFLGNSREETSRL